MDGDLIKHIMGMSGKCRFRLDQIVGIDKELQIIPYGVGEDKLLSVSNIGKCESHSLISHSLNTDLDS